jgi:hypothetical protein
VEFKPSREAAACIFPAVQGKYREKSQAKAIEYYRSKGYNVLKHSSREVLTNF